MRDVERSGDKKDLEVGGGGGDGFNGVFFMKAFIMIIGIYSKAWVGPQWECEMGGKDIKRGK